MPYNKHWKISTSVLADDLKVLHQFKRHWTADMRDYLIEAPVCHKTVVVELF